MAVCGGLVVNQPDCWT